MSHKYQARIIALFSLIVIGFSLVAAQPAFLRGNPTTTQRIHDSMGGQDSTIDFPLDLKSRSMVGGTNETRLFEMYFKDCHIQELNFDHNGHLECMRGVLFQGDSSLSTLEIVYRFLEKYKGAWGISDPRKEYLPRGTMNPRDGSFWINQYYKGTKLFRGSLSVSFPHNSIILQSICIDYYPITDLDVSHPLPLSEIHRRFARQKSIPDSLFLVNEEELGIDIVNGAPRLVYQGMGGAVNQEGWEYSIDAMNGEILDCRPAVRY
jgi:hypothetical protein